MSTNSTDECRHHRLRDAYRKQIGQLGVFIEGTLSGVRRPGRRRLAWQLTFKQDGKTRTVYVPAELVPEVKRWVREFKRMKALVRKVTGQSLAIIRRHGAVRRAASRARLPTAGSSGSGSSRSSGTASRT
jgi:hypothetical protein